MNNHDNCFSYEQKINYNEHMKRKTDKREQKSMELRVLKYFLMAAREENITRAAKLLHITQPTLSRQLMQLEEKLDKGLLDLGMVTEPVDISRYNFIRMKRRLRN